MKAVDDAGHDKNLDIKMAQLEKSDIALDILIKELRKKSDSKN